MLESIQNARTVSYAEMLDFVPMPLSIQLEVGPFFRLRSSFCILEVYIYITVISFHLAIGICSQPAKPYYAPKCGDVYGALSQATSIGCINPALNTSAACSSASVPGGKFCSDHPFVL